MRLIGLAVALTLGITLAPLAVDAQPTERIRRVGILLTVAAGDPEFQRRTAALAQGLGEAGWTDGRTLAFETRYAEGKAERLPALAADLAQTNVEVIVTQGHEGIDAARKASGNIPIVMASVGDAVGQGIVASLAHPGGNITGLSLFATEQAAKRLQLIKEIAPGLNRFAVIYSRNAPGHRLQLKEMERAAPELGIGLHSFPVRNAADIDAAFQAATQAKVQAVVTMEDLVIQFHRARIVERAMKQRLPVMSEFRPITAAGGLVSYGPDQVDMWRRAATYVDKILKGAKPGDLPVEQPTKFELVINLKTARALGLTIPQSVLGRADQVIQ
jgi:putative tryptophan/tyrosine transport system substrate-binding protein